MFFTILGPVFPEIVPEETISKTGGKSSRADFYIPEVRTIIELKFIPDNSKIKGLFSQLNDDLTLYSEKVEAEKIIFYIQRNPNTDLTKFQPIINKFRNINHIREGKRWKLIDCIVRPM